MVNGGVQADNGIDHCVKGLEKGILLAFRSRRDRIFHGRFNQGIVQGCCYGVIVQVTHGSINGRRKGGNLPL